MRDSVEPPPLTGDARTDWALWSLSQVMRDIAARTATEGHADDDDDTGEVAA